MPRRKENKLIKRKSISSLRTKMSYPVNSSGSIFKIKLSESYTSLILGFVVVLIGAILIFTFSKISQNRTYDKINTAASTYQELTTSAQKETQKIKTYEVKTGDNLWNIAEKVYGSGYNWVDLAKANNLSNPGVLFAGTKLIVPDVPKIVVQNSQSSITNAPPSITGSSYTIQKGDNLWDISVRAYGDGFKWSEIAKTNNLENPDLIFSENVLKLPR